MTQTRLLALSVAHSSLLSRDAKAAEIFHIYSVFLYNDLHPKTQNVSIQFQSSILEKNPKL